MQSSYAVSVCRVSTEKQDFGGTSLDDQLNQIEIAKSRVANQLNCKIEIIKNFELAESASVDFEHQPLQKVLVYCRESKLPIKFVFIKSLDRFTRAGATIFGQLKIEFSKLGITLIDTYGVVNGSQVNTLEHLGVEYEWSKYSPTFITELLEAERSKSEVRDIQTRMIGAAIRYVRLGYYCGGAAPLGYMTVKKETEHGKRFHLYPDPTESIWFKRMFEMKAQGTLTDGKIVEEINALGFKSRPFYHRDKANNNRIISKKGEIQLNIKNMRNYLSNPIYCGVDTQKWLEVPVYIRGESVVSIDLFNRANKGKLVIVDEDGLPKVYKGETPEWMHRKLKLNPEYPYKQFIVCPVCKRNLKGSGPRGKTKPIPTYHCSVHHKYWGINAKKLQTTIEEFVNKVEFSAKFKKHFVENFLKNWNLRMEQLNSKAIDWEKRLIELREQKTLAETQLKMATTSTGFEVIEKQLGDIKIQIADVMVKSAEVEDYEVDVQILINTAKFWMEHFKELVVETANPLTRASLFGLMFEKKPNYEELKNGTPKLSQLFALNEEYKTSQSTLSRAR